MKWKSGFIMTFMLLVVAVPYLAGPAEAQPLPSTEGTLRGRGFIYIGWPNPVGYVEVSIRVQFMRHLNALRLRASFEYTVFTEYYDEPIRTLRDAEVLSFVIETYETGYKATVRGTATFWEGTTTTPVDFEAVFYDGDGDGVVETFTVSHQYLDSPSPSTLVQGRISLRP